MDSSVVELFQGEGQGVIGIHSHTDSDIDIPLHAVIKCKQIGNTLSVVATNDDNKDEHFAN